MELSITIDFGESFVTYNIEGDGPLALSTYEEIAKLKAVISTQHFPNTNGITTKPSYFQMYQLMKQLVNYATDCIKPAITYFNQKFECDLKPIVTAFKYARYFDPTKITELKPCSTDIDNLKAFPFLIDHIEDSKKEILSYLAKVDDVSSEVDKLEWWKRYAMQLPRWSAACKLTLLVQPSSAVSRVSFFIADKLIFRTANLCTRGLY